MQPTDGFDKEFNRTYKALFSILFRIAYRITGDIGRAEDICHDAFIKFYKRGHPFPDLSQTKYWLIRVVKNIALNGEKRNVRERTAYEKLKILSPTSTGTLEEAFLKKEGKQTVQKALGVLPYKLRVVLVLKEYEGLTYKEIGSIIGISEGNVKVRVSRGREKLETIIKEWEGNVS